MSKPVHLQLIAANGWSRAACDVTMAKGYRHTENPEEVTCQRCLRTKRMTSPKPKPTEDLAVLGNVILWTDIVIAGPLRQLPLSSEVAGSVGVLLVYSTKDRLLENNPGTTTDGMFFVRGR